MPHSISSEISQTDNFTEQHALKGKVIVDAKYEKVEIRDGGIALVTDITGRKHRPSI